MLRVIYVGDFTKTWSTESHVARGFEANDCHVTRIQHPSPAWPKARIMADLERLRVDVEDHDLLVYQGSGLPLEACALWRMAERAGCKTASYHLDLYVGLPRQVQIDTDPFWRTGTVFTVDGDPTTAAYLAARGVNHRWLPAAVDEDEAKIDGTWRDVFDHDVVFVGSRSYHPEHPFRGRLLTYLSNRYARRFHCYDHHPPVRDLDLNDLYSTARVVVGDNLTLPGRTKYLSDRFTETLGRGGVLVFPRVSACRDLGFCDGSDYIGYEPGNLDDVGTKVDWALANHAEARRVCAQGRDHVLAAHTYRHRARAMLDALGLDRRKETTP